MILAERGVTVVPDIWQSVASSSRTSSGFRAFSSTFGRNEITSRLQEVMTRAFNRVWAAARKKRPISAPQHDGRNPSGCRGVSRARLFP